MNQNCSEMSSWLVRAEQARRVAGMLTGKDAEVAWAYARECETRATDLIDRWHDIRLAA